MNTINLLLNNGFKSSNTKTDMFIYWGLFVVVREKIIAISSPGSPPRTLPHNDTKWVWKTNASSETLQPLRSGVGGFRSSSAIWRALWLSDKGIRGLACQTLAGVIYYAALKIRKASWVDLREYIVEDKKNPTTFPHYRTWRLHTAAPRRLIATLTRVESFVCFSVPLPVINHTAALAHTGVVSQSRIIYIYWLISSGEPSGPARPSLLAWTYLE